MYDVNFQSSQWVLRMHGRVGQMLSAMWMGDRKYFHLLPKPQCSPGASEPFPKTHRPEAF